MARPEASVPERARGSRSSKATQRGPQTRGELTRKRILEAAEGLFARLGYSGTSLAAIAEQAGMHEPGIIYYFPDKWALYEAVVADAVGAIEKPIVAALTSARSPEDRLQAAATEWVEQLVARPNVANLLLRESANPEPTTMPRAIPEMGQRVQTLMQDLVREIQPNAHPDDVFYIQSAMTGSSLFYATALQRLMSGQEESDPQHSMAHHKKLLQKTVRFLLKEIRAGRS